MNDINMLTAFNYGNVDKITVGNQLSAISCQKKAIESSVLKTKVF